MKALILSAGLGTRLLPHTRFTPKPLFPVGGRPMIDKIIQDLAAAGCRKVIVNTHHLHEKVEAHIADSRYPMPVVPLHEPEILGTGGAIANAGSFLGRNPFLVINCDVFTDIDLKAVYRFHLGHSHPATMVMHDRNPFNKVLVNRDDFVVGFSEEKRSCDDRKLAFTGIQVLNTDCLPLIPPKTFSSSIDMYKKMIDAGRGVKAFITSGHRWQDIGTPERYRQTVREELTQTAFQKAFGEKPAGNIEAAPLAGDGSDRQWWRLTRNANRLIMVDHGIRQQPETVEADAFVRIGKHLHESGAAVPRIFHADTFSGLVFLEDLGNTHLQQVIDQCAGEAEILQWYRLVIDELIILWRKGARNFQPEWTYQTAAYDRQLVLEKECRYFLEAFLNGWAELDVPWNQLAPLFEEIAEGASSLGSTGFMHRDAQSRNIMIHENRIRFIDFQGGRIGPLEYDVASLLIDPYVKLPPDIQEALLEYAAQSAINASGIHEDRFLRAYRYCALARNLQMLGAFGFLSRKKGKTQFEQYIPAALTGLKGRLEAFGTGEALRLLDILRRLPLSHRPIMIHRSQYRHP